MTTATLAPTGRWTRSERVRLSGIAAVVVALHVVGWTICLAHASSPVAAGTFAGAGVLAYALGVRHAFDADHIAAIDDTTRLMMQRGRRPVGVGFFFAMGHSSLVVVLSLVVALAAGYASEARIAAFRDVGGVVSALVAMGFLAVVAALNAVVLVGVARLWRAMRAGSVTEAEIDDALVNRGLVNRVLGGRARALIRSSWHMYPLGILFGLGLETASEVTLLTLAASLGSGGAGGALPLVAVLSLPLIFAAGMSTVDTADGLVMSRAYSWANRHPARRLYYNLATTGLTVVVAAFVSSVYLAALLAEHAGLGVLAPYGALAGDFELLGYGVVALFVLVWGGSALLWRVRFAPRYAGAPTGADGGAA